MSERMTDEWVEELRYKSDWGRDDEDRALDELIRARASEDAKDKEIERLKAANAAAEAMIATLTSQMAAVTESTLAERAERYAEIDRLKADNARLVAICMDARTALHEGVVVNDRRIKMLVSLADSTTSHPGYSILEELIALRAQVATLISGQQRNGEARQQARVDMAHELAEMEPEARERTIRRIIDNHEDK